MITVAVAGRAGAMFTQAYAGREAGERPGSRAQFLHLLLYKNGGNRCRIIACPPSLMIF